MIIEIKVLSHIKSHSSLSMDSWYYDDMYEADVLMKYDDLSQNMKDYIFDKGNFRECFIIHGSMLHGKYVKYIFKPIVLSRFEIEDNIVIDLEDGDILHTQDDVDYIKSVFENNGITSLYEMNFLNEYMFMEVSK